MIKNTLSYKVLVDKMILCAETNV